LFCLFIKDMNDQVTEIPTTSQQRTATQKHFHSYLVYLFRTKSSFNN
jgi:hypothetical protein